MAKKKRKSAAQQAKDIEILERGTKVIELRKSGASFRAIAKKLKESGDAEVSYQTCRRDFQAAMKILREDREEIIDEYFELQVERAESLMLAFWVLAIGKTERIGEGDKEEIKHTKPSISAAYLYMTIWRELNELFGFKAPQKVEHSGSIAVPTKVYAGFDPDKV